MNATQVIDQLEAAMKAAMSLARELATARGDADEWARFPSGGSRCAVSGWSRAKIDRLTRAGKVRRKSVGQSVFYSAADVRRMLNA
jgi:DNA-binding transcriptional ArsR family regulator